MLNCTKGPIDDSNFSKPMPIIGLYIAGATLLCIIAMVMDLVKGFKSKQLWIPARYFSIDAASLAVIGVAIKLSVDLNSPMPSQIDQLAKFVTSAFICTVLVNMMPSVGKLEKGELLANTIALAILIITSIVNLQIQLNTGVIHAFRKTHRFMICIMSIFLELYLLLAIITLPVIKNRLQIRFEKLHQQALKELFSDSNNKEIKKSMKLKKFLEKFSMMAQSSCPQFVLSRSLLCTSPIFGLMPASALLFVIIATIAHKDEMVGVNTCNGESDYGWSVLGILITQATAVAMGLVVPVSRLIYFIKALKVGSTSRPHSKKESPEGEKFWMKRLIKTKDDPVFLGIKIRRRSLTLYYMKVVLDVILYVIKLQATMLFVFNFNVLLFLQKVNKIDERTSSNNSNQESIDLRPYFLHEEREKGLIEYMVESSSRVTHKYINAEKREPKNLITFLKEHLSHDFGGVSSFESKEVRPLHFSDGHPPNCWALPVVTMACIATALPNIDHTSKERLKNCLSDGLMYVKIVEDNLNAIHDLVNIRAAAHNRWLRLDLSCSWLDVDLEKLAHNSKSPREVLMSLAKSAKEDFSKFVEDNNGKNKCVKLLKQEFANVAVAAHSMFTICETILQDRQNEDNLDLSTSNDIFKKLCKTMADILGACFTNLRQCILLECKRSTIEKRRETAFRMLKLFGETERIMGILEDEGRTIPELSNEKMAFIDEWRSHLRTKEQSRTQSEWP